MSGGSSAYCDKLKRVLITCVLFSGCVSFILTAESIPSCAASTVSVGAVAEFVSLRLQTLW